MRTDAKGVPGDDGLTPLQLSRSGQPLAISRIMRPQVKGHDSWRYDILRRPLFSRAPFHLGNSMIGEFDLDSRFDMSFESPGGLLSEARNTVQPGRISGTGMCLDLAFLGRPID